ncbi:hypothetical protein SEA_FRANKLIN22_37 [Microbacterium phage Franklin22]|uniref:hypothetical protein n=1 Tax=Microbacterium phage Franklin22 TaxID=2894293 RepID=UPI001E6D0EB3|nr:hypothetical protein QDW15_gp37 [Microbacterium phage Franklin22]UGL61850.1 hypothetical protein SEA_FRANKLIN22_37 [Microbacterium phage Franklin22]
MNIIKHEEILDFVQSAEHIAHNFTTEEYEEVDSTSIIYQCMGTIENCCEEWLTDIFFAIGPKGYSLHYEPAIAGMNLDEMILNDFLPRALSMVEEDLFGNDEDR